MKVLGLSALCVLGMTACGASNKGTLDSMVTGSAVPQVAGVSTSNVDPQTKTNSPANSEGDLGLPTAQSGVLEIVKTVVRAVAAVSQGALTLLGDQPKSSGSSVSGVGSNVTDKVVDKTPPKDTKDLPGKDTPVAGTSTSPKTDTPPIVPPTSAPVTGVGSVVVNTGSGVADVSAPVQPPVVVNTPASEPRPQSVVQAVSLRSIKCQTVKTTGAQCVGLRSGTVGEVPTVWQGADAVLLATTFRDAVINAGQGGVLAKRDPYAINAANVSVDCSGYPCEVKLDVISYQ